MRARKHTKWEIRFTVFAYRCQLPEATVIVFSLNLQSLFTMTNTAGRSPTMHWITVLSLPCTVYFVWDKNHARVTAKKHLKGNQFSSPMTELQPDGGCFDWLALWWQGACRRTHLALLWDDSTMQRKWALHSKIKCSRRAPECVSEHQKHCCPNTVSSVLTQLGLSHTSHTAGQIAFTLIRFFNSFSHNQGKRSPSAGCEWLKQRGKALLSSEWITSACRFVNTRHFEMAVTAAL